MTFDLFTFDCLIIFLEVVLFASSVLLLIQKKLGLFLFVCAVVVQAIMKDCFWLYQDEKKRKIMFYLLVQDVVVITVAAILIAMHDSLEYESKHPKPKT